MQTLHKAFPKFETRNEIVSLTFRNYFFDTLPLNYAKNYKLTLTLNKSGRKDVSPLFFKVGMCRVKRI